MCFFSSVGGSTFFNPYFMYKFTIRLTFSFLCTSFCVLIHFRKKAYPLLFFIPSVFCLLERLPVLILPISLATTLGFSVDFHLLVLRCFNSQLFFTFSVCFRIMVSLCFFFGSYKPYTRLIAVLNAISSTCVLLLL